MEQRIRLNPLQQRTLYAFSISLVRILTDLSLEEADKLFQVNSVDEIEEVIKKTLSSKKDRKLFFTDGQRFEISKIISLIRDGDETAVLSLNKISKGDSRFNAHFVDARRYFLKKIEWTVRSPEESSEWERETSNQHSVDATNYLLSAIDSTLNCINNIECKSDDNTELYYYLDGASQDEKIKKSTVSDSSTSLNVEVEIPKERRLDTPCYVYAEIEDRVIVRRTTTLAVTISGQEIHLQTDFNVSSGVTKVSTEDPLLIEIIPTSNLIIDRNTSKVEFLPPHSDQQYEFLFDVKSTDAGEGEVLVMVSQRHMPLLTLTLKTEIVDSQAGVRVSTSKKKKKKAAKNFLEASMENSVCGSFIDLPFYDESINKLHIRECINGNQITYEYFLASQELEVFEYFFSLPITGDRQTFIQRIYQNIENRWVSNSDDDDAFTAELRAYGGSLFNELFPHELRTILWEHRYKLTNILVISNEPFIPWELVHPKPPRQVGMPEETRFFGQMGLVRWVFTNFPPRKIKIRPGRAAYVIPNYPNKLYYLPQAQEESRYLEKTFNAQPVEPKSKSVRRLLQTGAFDLLHFAGHGEADQNSIGDSKLLMQGRIEKKKYIHDYLSATTVKEFSHLSSQDKNRPMVVLNACQIGRQGQLLTSTSGFAPSFLRAGAGAFIGPLWMVGDQSARVFVEAIYKELLSGKTLSEATVEAREKSREESRGTSDVTWLAYAVYGHPKMTIDVSREKSTSNKPASSDICG